MDKESIIELQKIDCNCNNCIHMVRDIEKYNRSLTLHEQWQRDYFETIKRKRIEAAKRWKEEGEQQKHDNIMKEVAEMRFEFDKSDAAIQYGNCSKYDNKAVSFIPNTCQLDTQHCFQHRRIQTQNP